VLVVAAVLGTALVTFNTNLSNVSRGFRTGM